MQCIYEIRIIHNEMNPHFLARFPFCEEATRFVRKKGIDLGELLTGIAYEGARERGRKRVIDALEEGEIKDHPLTEEFEYLQEILSYPIARMIVSCVADSFLTRRYALAEAVTMNRRLKGEDLETVVGMAERLKVEASVSDGSLSIHFTDYLKNTSRIRSRDWKLVNTEVFSGYVFLTKSRFCRVLQQALQDRIEEELPLPVSDMVLERLNEDSSRIKEMVETRRERYKAEDLGKVSIIRFPPCMKKLVAIAQAGENVPHSGRFALTTFLHHIGLSAEEILNLFASSPDFDASKTRYQIEHITGETSGTEYTPPECATMKSYGVCFEPDALCEHENVNHPLTYYKIKGAKRKKGKGSTEQE